jgi:hypothetical protein
MKQHQPFTTTTWHEEPYRNLQEHSPRRVGFQAFLSHQPAIHPVTTVQSNSTRAIQEIAAQLARVQDAFGVKGLLDAVHQSQT